SLISLNESDEDKLYDVSDSVNLFTQLSADEKKIVMKFRLMNAEKQDEIINLIDNLEESN
ncbi:MAG: hypothetical protein KBT46_06205, partial [Ruminococcus sp.]|nr:hypothetical protein [Candidatus Copronaster equi]